jgi:nitric oxide reductase large subunit
MSGINKHAVLLVLAWTSLGASLLALLAVAERLFAALWQWYKFSGYETPGVITLSSRTAWLFAALMMALIMVSLAIRRLEAQSTGRASAIARLSFWTSAISITLFVALAFSSLNHWRP